MPQPDVHHRRRRVPHRRLRFELEEVRINLSAVGFELHEVDPWQIVVEDIADLNGDGSKDIIGYGVAEDISNIGWRANLGDGTFGAANLVTTLPEKQNLIRAIDVDVDGDMDLLAVQNDVDLVWFENVDGRGNFGRKKSVDVSPESVQFIDQADLDDDGDDDLIVGRSGPSGGSRVWYENLDGQFVVRQTLGQGPARVVIFDLDQDGDLDIIPRYATTWYENSPAGFIARRLLTETHLGVVADDIDNNGRVDLIVTDARSIEWYEALSESRTDQFELRQTFGDESDLYRLTSSSGYTTDLDGDGMTDIIFFGVEQDPGRIWTAWYELGADGRLQSREDLSSTGDPLILLDDLGGDGSDDLIYSNKWIPYDVIEGKFGSSVALSSLPRFGRHLVDLDGDHDLDIVSAIVDRGSVCRFYDFAVCSTQIAWSENTDGLGTFGPWKTILNSPNEFRNLQPIDMDNDNDLDLMFVSFSDFGPRMQWLENIHGNGDFEALDELEFLTGGEFLAVDFDADGDADVVTLGDKVSWHENLDGQGHMNLEGIEILNARAMTDGMRLFDWDGDGDADVLTYVYDRSRSRDLLVWYERIDDEQVFSERQTLGPIVSGLRYAQLSFVDVDADNDFDLITSTFRHQDRLTTLYLNSDGKGTLSAPIVIDNRAHRSISAVDFDGDGDQDLVPLAVYSSSEVWYENVNGRGDFVSRSIRQDVTATGDIDSDGDIDTVDGRLRATWSERRNVGDSNGDNIFDSTDLIFVDAIGEYDDGIPNNSRFTEGDWNGDGDFDSTDFVYAFTHGNFQTRTVAKNLLAAVADAQQDKELKNSKK